ncbi:phage tail-collar fiber domain-containing protein [Serratia sp. D1N4]
MTKFFALLTTLGAAKLANAAALGTQLDLTQLAVGDGGGTLPTPDPAQTALKGEKRRAAINMLSIDPANANQIIAEQVIPENEGGWWIREIGLFDKDGTLIAVANCPETYKPQLQEGSGRTQTLRMVLIVSSTEAVTLKIDPATVLATRDYVDSELKKHAESRNHPDASITVKGFVQLSSATNSASETLAATPKAVKAAYDLAASKLSSVPDATTAAKGLVQLNSATNSASETLAATPKAVKAAYDLAASKLSSVPDATTAAKGVVQLNSAIDSAVETQAATPKAVKTVSDAAVKRASNLADIPDKAVARNNLGLKAAALRDVGGATGQLMEVGAFGLGSVGTRITDANSADKNGFYSLEANKSSSTPIASASWEMLCIKYDAGSAKQLFWQAGSASTKMYIRTRTSPGGQWGPFQYFYSTENKPTAAEVGALARTDFPVGIPQPWPTNTAPTGWLKCNGAAFDKAKYPLLAVAYPSGTLPDLRGEFIRGWDDGRGVDSGRILLSAQQASKVGGQLYGNNDSGRGNAWFTDQDVPYEGWESQRIVVMTSETWAPLATGTDTGAATGVSRNTGYIRPRNIAFNYIVRAA